MNNYSHYEVWDEITYSFPGSRCSANEIWEAISIFVPHFTGYLIEGGLDMRQVKN